MTGQDMVMYGLSAVFIGAMFIPLIGSKFKKKD
jgi:hypothetical protein